MWKQRAGRVLLSLLAVEQLCLNPSAKPLGITHSNPNTASELLLVSRQ